MIESGLSKLARTGLNDLVRMQREWKSLLPGATVAPAGGAGQKPGSLLQPVALSGSNPGELDMFAYSPPDLPEGAPLVVLLHGCTQTAAGLDAGTGWSVLASRHRFALLAPEQRRANNANQCFNWFEPKDVTRGHGEAASIRAMVAQIQSSHKTDARRIFVTGLSAGGAMANALLATYPDTFAAGAILAGLPYGCATNVSEALAAMRHCPTRSAKAWGNQVREAAPPARSHPIVSVWHGSADSTVAPSAAEALASQWCDVHGIAGGPAEDTLDGARRRQWRDANGTVRVEQVIVPGLGHGAPISPSQPGDRGVGHAAPYVLDCAIASTYHIAKAWGVIA